MSHYLCPTCGRVSYHPKDAEHRYCAVCGFEDRNPGGRVLPGDANFERVLAADQAIRSAISELVRKWLDEAEKAGGSVSPRLMFRAIMVGGIKGLVEIAADWGVIGDTADEIGAGFERTAAAAALLHLKGRKVGWAMQQANKELGEP